MTVQFGLDRLCKHRAILRECRECNPYGFEPRARRTDPVTSHEAAASLPSEHVRRSQALILDLLREQGPLTDDRIYRWHRITAAMSPSGARTRRAELVLLGKVRDSGRTEVLPSGRRAIVWQAVE